MEPTNQIPPQQTSVPQPPVAPLAPLPVQPPVVVKPVDNLKNKFNSLPKTTKILILIMAALFLLIFLLSILVMLFGKKQGAVVVLPSPTPISVTPAPNVILNASRYATDSGVLKIEANLNNIQKQLEVTDIKQSDLNIPNLDYNINFNQ